MQKAGKVALTLMSLIPTGILAAGLFLVRIYAAANSAQEGMIDLAKPLIAGLLYILPTIGLTVLFSITALVTLFIAIRTKRKLREPATYEKVLCVVAIAPVLVIVGIFLMPQ